MIKIPIFSLTNKGTMNVNAFSCSYYIHYMYLYKSFTITKKKKNENEYENRENLDYCKM